MFDPSKLTHLMPTPATHFFRIGQWVKFEAIPGLDEAHRSRDGKIVGIYCEDGVHPVKEDGLNFVISTGTGPKPVFSALTLSPHLLHSLEPAHVWDDLPPARALHRVDGRPRTENRG